MNILIVGNGFDLSHYLPTKYDHFMVVMDVIENWDEAKGDMGFDDLFGSLYEKEDYFFGYTKAMYKTEEIQIPVAQIEQLQYRLKENVWFQYFSDHVREVQTWIDIENKIEEILLSFAHVLPFIERINHQSQHAFNHHEFDTEVGKRNSIILKKFDLFEEKGLHKGFNSKFCYGSNDKNGVNPSLFLNFLNKKLDEFIEIFNLYLEMIVSKLSRTNDFTFKGDNWVFPEKIYSFNYTNTYERIYNSVKIEYLHGRHGEQQNIVLGVSDIDDEYLKKLKAYGLTKYHQKLFKETDYLFLSEIVDHFFSTEKAKKTLEDEINTYLDNPMLTSDVYFRAMFDAKRNDFIHLSTSTEETYNIKVWGHSLDRSDSNYIKEIFSFNGELIEHRCNVVIYYFHEQAKFDLLNNLLDIIGKIIVEKWMKKGWLKFEKNPDIAKLNGIKPVELPKYQHPKTVTLKSI
ncbi:MULTISPECIES: AbiH family protein [unclassified Acinetobacter]|uniref:AbiH family protein n=1 Tax=unclassified Acinetobacter TaxID=196816 RepID=UPI0015D1EC76|nr:MULTISPECIES: AbiH family protein [unclassified Acinetobacter]UIJ76070.1 bacteriophage abortive infection AbiH family protein [Acinetobacter sp. SH20PTE14]